MKSTPFFLDFLHFKRLFITRRFALSSTPTSSTISAVLPSKTPLPSATFSPTPSLTNTWIPSPSEIPTSTLTPTPTTIDCTNKAEFVRHLSVSDNTKIVAGTFFAKVWRIHNIGTCTWTLDYWFIFEAGDKMSSPTETQFYKMVDPGETIDLQVVLVAPLEARTYHGDWLLRDPTGAEFGVGETGSQPISAIVVVEPYKSDFQKETLPCG